MTPTGIETAVILKGIKYAVIAMFVWLIEPIFNFIISQVDTVGFLTPHMKDFLSDIKILLGVFVTLLLAVKYIVDIWRSKKNQGEK